MTDLYKAMISDLHKHVDMVQRHVEKCLGQTVQFLRTLEEANYLADPLKEEFRDLTEDASSLLKTSFQKLSESLSDAVRLTYPLHESVSSKVGLTFADHERRNHCH
jgi:cell fate (sporulation/competence/biofilm development) regulator YmcA (YheA/YmcA/DUF963 family)